MCSRATEGQSWISESLPFTPRRKGIDVISPIHLSLLWLTIYSNCSSKKTKQNKTEKPTYFIFLISFLVLTLKYILNLPCLDPSLDFAEWGRSAAWKSQSDQVTSSSDILSSKGCMLHLERIPTSKSFKFLGLPYFAFQEASGFLLPSCSLDSPSSFSLKGILHFFVFFFLFLFFDWLF